MNEDTTLQVRQRDFEQSAGDQTIDEVQHVAAELHDSVGQELVGISMMLSALARSPGAQRAGIQERLCQVAALMQQAIISCRRVSEGFGGFLIHGEGVRAALQHCVSGFSQEAPQIKFSGSDIPKGRLNAAQAYYLFGIGREAIFNAIRHSHASTVHVNCQLRDDVIWLIVEDDGVGIARSTSKQQGIGRFIMEHRARRLGARLAFSEASMGGIRVECELRSSLGRVFPG